MKTGIMNSNGKSLGVAVAILVAGALSSYAIDGIFANGVTWAHSYEGDVMPTANVPALSTNATFSGGTDGSVLSITNGYGQMNNITYWNGNSVSGSTFEVRMRVTSQTSTYASYFEIGNSTGYAGLKIATNKVLVSGTGISAAAFSLDATQFHTYRIALTNNVISFGIYDDGTLLGAYNIAGGTYNAFDFGYGTGGVAGTSDYDFVRWTNAGAFAVPEPSAALFGITTAVAFLAMRRRAR